jgi:2-amino-4-hydroxy-6-hydroxymethyldihydropteridine diphosphokinase/dihydropteroate synthase
MVILGLGSNLGDRLAHLRYALKLIQKIPAVTVSQVSPIYISDALLPENAPPSWNVPYLNLAIRCETTEDPYNLLHHLKNIEKTVGRRPEKEWGPRIIDIDILAWDDLIQYDDKLHIPHEDLHERPFALWPLADVAPEWIYPLPSPFQGKTAAEMVAAWGSRFTGNALLHTKQILQRIDTPQLIGILNVTPDSFSDGGKFTHPETALQQAFQLVADGAEIIDIGAEASGPRAIALTPAVEWERLEPVLTLILNNRSSMLITPKISVDTRHAEVAEKALALGIDLINDVSGLTDPAMIKVIANSTQDVVIMHQLGIPANPQITIPATANPISTVYLWAEEQLAHLEQAGIDRQRIILDVGIGFGKTAEQSLLLLQHIHIFKQLNVRLLIGHSRKSFLQLFTPYPAELRDVETVATSLYLSGQLIDYLRVHNIEMNARAFKVAHALNISLR